jgi:nitroreductase
MLKAIKKRRSHRKYQEKEVEEKKINEVLKAAMFSPSSHHRRPWEFIIVKDKKKLNQLATVTPWASFLVQAPVAIVVCSSEDHYNWIEDCSIAAENIYLEATHQDLGTCFIQIRHQENKHREKKVKEILSIPDQIRVLNIMPLGYPKEELEKHGQKEFEQDKIHWEQY